MRYSASFLAIGVFFLSATQSLALRSDVSMTVADALPERHTLHALQGETLWYVLVDIASRCGTHKVGNSAACFSAGEDSAGPKTLPTLN